ncbi:NLP/P60 protein [Gracilibacillus boraciitolerans JCM 21714]|uniref:NLP/P60 protein n=1 Tax=Gracilibacillus boraciitolerans JCM 21714 TaxID=1298598 RepID=W4VDZ6_9BACI|nr:NlpC/P60 family protein [Gracilibacillus boraciitolerans]GAE91417.1 NLP/P60 protein [Gracilibacillus boraciitolerans JCM 21714]
MMLQEQLSQVVKHSVAYSFAFSQPFSFYVDAYPMMQNQILEQSNILKYGMQHESIRMLQHKLQRLSYYDSSIDGEFGALTEYALKKFQQDHLLEQTGKADQKTIKQIIEKEENYYLQQLEEIGLDFVIGDKGDQVELLQEALLYFGYYRANVDGVFGDKSDQALKAYKQDKGLEIHHIKTEIKEEKVVVPKIAAVQVVVKKNIPNEKDGSTEETKKKEDKQKEILEADMPIQDEIKTASAPGLVANAKAFIGTPYLWGGGTTTAGFDCSGYLQYVFQQIGVSLPRTVSDMWNATKPVNQPSVGDLVFFETYKPGPSHAGIYLGNGQFIHAGESKGVEITNMDNSYWSPRYLGAKRIALP